MRYLPLTKGKRAMVDDTDYEYLSRWKWTYNPQNRYAYRRVGGKNVLMHRAILDVPEGFVADHINGNRTDNRRRNLRIATAKLNQLNRTCRNRNNTSGYPGVTWARKAGKWQAQIMLDRRTHQLGYFSSKRKAVKVRREAHRAAIRQELARIAAL